MPKSWVRRVNQQANVVKKCESQRPAREAIRHAICLIERRRTLENFWSQILAQFAQLQRFGPFEREFLERGTAAAGVSRLGSRSPRIVAPCSTQRARW